MKILEACICLKIVFFFKRYQNHAKHFFESCLWIFRIFMNYSAYVRFQSLKRLLYNSAKSSLLMKSKKNKKFKTNKDQNRQSKSNLPKKISINRMIKHLLANNKFHEIQIARVEIFLTVLNRLKWLFETNSPIS